MTDMGFTADELNEAERMARVHAGVPGPIGRTFAALLAVLGRVREDVAMYERWAAESPRYDAECPCGNRVSVRTVATEDVQRWQAMEARARDWVADNAVTTEAEWRVASHILGEDERPTVEWGVRDATGEVEPAGILGEQRARMLARRDGGAVVRREGAGVWVPA